MRGLWCFFGCAALISCGGDDTSSNANGGSAGASAAGSSGTGGTSMAGSSAAGTGAGSSGGNAGTGGSSSSTGGSAGAAGSTSTIDLCDGLVQDLDDHTQTALSQPALGETVTDAEFGTTIRRITAVGDADGAIVPMYSTISAWNADESRLILYDVGGGHELYDGKTYEFIRGLDIDPSDLEQVYWDTADPDVLYFVSGQTLVRFDASDDSRSTVRDFSDICGTDDVSNGSDPMFTSWDSQRLGLTCNGQMFIYDQSTDAVLGLRAVSGTPPAQVAPSGTLAYLPDGMGAVLDENLMPLRELTLQEPDNHASLGQLANGHDTWNGAVYDDVDENVGNLVTWDLTNATPNVIIGPKTGFPYPPDGHVSALAYERAGWVVVSTISDNTTGPQNLLDQELLLADTNTGTVCRIGRHRSFGKNNGVLSEPYWAEPHAVPSPSGTRVLFASDWGGGASVDSYVVELPSYH